MPQVLTVSEINKYIKGLLTYDGVLSSLWVKGEISNFKKHYSGHLYFTLKDENSLIKCVMFKTYADKLLFDPIEGMKVLIRGNVTVFERDGVYQLYAEGMKPDGVGDLFTAFEQLKAKLGNEGLFDDSRKQAIPVMPNIIGVITSETGSVIKDIINVLTRRFPQIKLRLYPCPVQGGGAGAKIAKAVELLNQYKICDVIIIARGGGSLEDLMPFNEEIVARAVTSSRIPVISAVGHETDYTICDFVADLRAPTPSAAAELAVPDYMSVKAELASISERVRRIPYFNLEIKRKALDMLKATRVLKDPYSLIIDSRLELAACQENLFECVKDIFKDVHAQNALFAAKLDGLSPLKILARGYGAVKDKSGQVINSVENVSKGDEIFVHMNKGVLECEVKSVSQSQRRK